MNENAGRFSGVGKQNSRIAPNRRGRFANSLVRTFHNTTHRPVLYLIPAIFALASLSGALETALTANPANGTLTDVSGPLMYTAGPFFVANPTAQANGTPICNAATPCDDYTLTVSVPAGFAATHKVKVVIGWPLAAADFDVYVLQGTTGETVVTTAASSSDPEIAQFSAVSGTYRIRVAPFAPAGQSITGFISLVQNPALPPPPAGIAPRYKNHLSPESVGDEAGEPSIGVDWNINCPATTAGCANLHPDAQHPKRNTGGVAFFTANVEELRVSFDDCSSPASTVWEDKTSPQTSAGGLDPIGYVDSQTGRVFQSQLSGPAGSITVFSDDDGETWTASQGAGQPAGIDHQTLGGGPFAPGAPPHPLYPNAVYYASQDAATALIARSDNGGLTFGPGIPMYNLTQCGGLHGHVKVAPDGTVYVPNKGCGGAQGVVVSTDNGLTWAIRTVPGSTPGDTDPSVGIGTDNTLYFGYQNGDGHPHMARSTDRGLTWIDRDVGGGFIQNCVFPEAVAGDGDRAAFGFLGTPTGGNYQDATNFHGIWHFYIATTYDRGLTYFLVDATPGDPVQIGSICTGGTTCGSDRNLLDFNDIGIDKQGRVLAAYADGCIAPGCKEDPASPSTASRTAKAAIIRQSGGRRLLAAFDPVEPAPPAAPHLLSAVRDASGVTVKWEEPDHSGSPITSYKVHRGVSSGGETFLASTGPATTKYLDTTADPLTPYFYRVTAVNGSGEGTFCGELQVTAAPPTETACLLPGITIVNDPPGDQTGSPLNTGLDITKISMGEPFLHSCSNQLVFTMKVTDLMVLPQQARWTIFFSRPNGVEHFVNMGTDDETNPGGIVFKYGHTEIGAGGVRQLVTEGDADPGSSYSNDGTVVIVLSNSKLTFNPLGTPFPPPAPGESFGNVNGITQQTAGVLLATIDSTSSSGYTLVGNRSCQINNAPVAVLEGVPGTGTAPLMVNFNGSLSSDPDLCDTIASYTFDFGDGSPVVTQASPTISHSYANDGEYRATLKVTDSRGKLSDNTAEKIIEVIDCAEDTNLGSSGECFTHNADNGVIAVFSPPLCNWSAVPGATWITVTSIGSGTGDGNINYTVDANNTGVRRSGPITVSGKTFTVLEGVSFFDVAQTNSFFTVIGKLSARGITVGCGNGNFCPKLATTREQVAAFIIRALGEFNPPEPASQRFADVPPTNGFYSFIDRLAVLGITQGCGGANYCPSAAVTREQMAAFVMRALGEFNPPTPQTQRFADVPPSNPFYAFIDRLAARGITLGCGTNGQGQQIFCPSDPVTREQMAAFLVRAFGCP